MACGCATESGAKTTKLSSTGDYNEQSLPISPILEDYGNQLREFQLFSAKDNYFDKRQVLQNRKMAENDARMLAKLSLRDQELIRRGNQLYAQKNFAAALRCCEIVRQHVPNFWQLSLASADILSRQNKYLEAIERLNIPIDTAQGKRRMLNLRAYCYFKLKRYQEGIADCQSSLAINDDAAVYRNRAAAYRVLGKTNEASFDERMAEKIEARMQLRDLVSQGNFTQALSSIESFISKHPGDPESRLNRGIFLLILARYQEAITDFTMVLTLSKDFSGIAHASRAVAYEELGEHKKAIVDCSMALDAIGRNLVAPYNRFVDIRQLELECLRHRALEYIRLKTPELAIPDCNKLIAMNQTHSSFYTLRGDAYAAAGNFNDALNDYKFAEKLDPKSGYAILQCARVEENMNKPTAAIEQYTRLLKMYPHIPNFFLARAQQKERLNLHKDAVADISKAIELQPENDYFYERRAEIYCLLGAAADARKDYLEAIKINPGSAKIISKKLSLIPNSTN